MWMLEVMLVLTIGTQMLEVMMGYRRPGRKRYRTKYRKKHGREPPPLEAPGHNDATWRALPAKTDVFLTEGKAPERPKPKPPKPPPAPPKPAPPPAPVETAPPALVARLLKQAEKQTAEKSYRSARGVYEALLQAGATERATRGLATMFDYIDCVSRILDEPLALLRQFGAATVPMKDSKS